MEQSIEVGGGAESDQSDILRWKVASRTGQNFQRITNLLELLKLKISNTCVHFDVSSILFSFLMDTF